MQCSSRRLQALERSKQNGVQSAEQLLRARQQLQSAAELSATQGRYAVLVRKATLQYTQVVELERSRARLDAESRRVEADLRLQLAAARELEFVRRRAPHVGELVRVGQLRREELALYVRLATRLVPKEADALLAAIGGLQDASYLTGATGAGAGASRPELLARREARMAARLLVLLESLYGEVSQAALADPRIPSYSQRPYDRDQRDSRDRYPSAYGQQQPLSALRPLDEKTGATPSAAKPSTGERDFAEEKARYLRRIGSLKAPSEYSRGTSGERRAEPPLSLAESPDRFAGVNMNFQEREWPTARGLGNSRLQPERRSERDWEPERERAGLRPGLAVPVASPAPAAPSRWRDSSLSPPPPQPEVVVSAPEDTRSASRARRTSEWESQSRERFSPTEYNQREAGLRRQEPSSYNSSSLSSRVSPEPRSQYSDDWSSGRKRDSDRPPPYDENTRYSRRNDL